MPEAVTAGSPRAPVRSRTFEALAIPDYRRFYLGQGVSLVGTWLQQAAVSWLVFEMTRSTRMLGLVEAAGLLPGLVVGLVAGALADRVRPRAMILGMQAGQMLLAFLLALLVGSGAVWIWQLAAILALARVCVAFEMPSRQVLLHDLVGPAGLMNAIALNSGLFNASRVLGPALAGACLARFGAATCFALNGASYLAAIAALLSIRAGLRPGERRGRGLAEALGGIAHLRRDRRTAALFGLMVFFGVVGMGYSALVPAYARLVVGTGALGYSLLLACSGLGATAGALVVASLGGLRRKESLVLGGMALFAAALAAAGLLPPLALRSSEAAALAVASACLVGVGFGAVLFYSSTQTLIQTAIPDHLRGRIMGLWMIGFSGSVPLGALWAGELAARHGVALVMEVSAALCLATAAALGALGTLAARPAPPPDPMA